MEMGELDALLAAGRYAELQRRLRDDDLPADSSLRLRGALASHGRGPVSDLVRFAEVLRDDEDARASEVSAEAVRRLAAAGAGRTAQRVLDDALDRWPDDEHLALSRDQLAAKRPIGSTRAEWEVHRLLDDARLEDALDALDRAIESGDTSSRGWALRLATDLHRRDHRFARAAECLETARLDAPEADDAALLRSSEAMARWAAGEMEGALRALHALRDETVDATGAGGFAHTLCKDVLEALDRDPAARDAGPRWTLRDPLPPMAPLTGPPGSAVVAWARAALDLGGGRPDEPLPTLPHVRRALAGADLASIRIRASEDVLGPALSRCALVILEEERPTDTGFLVVVGWDPIARLLLLQDPARPGPFLRSLGDQRARSALFDSSALAIVGAGDDGRRALAELEPAGVAHDPRLDVVDQLEMDPDGNAPPQARIAALAEQALEAAPDHPLPRKRLGESLLAQLRRGARDGGRFERWYAEARRRFPDAEWPFQIYAQSLEHQGRPHEAGIAWSDAAVSDPFDERNFVGMARVHAMIGALDRAETQLSRASTLRPSDADATARRADLALRRGDLDGARVLSEMAVDLSDTDVTAAFVRATVLERDDRFDEAADQLRRVEVLDERSSWARVRRVRRHVHDARWSDAEEAAASLRAVAPRDEDTWAIESWLGFCTGDVERAVGAAQAGIQRTGPGGALVDALSRALGSLMPASDIDGALDAVVPLLSGAPRALLDLASALAGAWLVDEAEAVGRHAVGLTPGNANGPWRVAQILLGDRRARAARIQAVHALLDDTIERAGNYPHPRIVKGLLIVDEDPDAALALARDADPRVAPALVWTLVARAFERLDRAADAKEVRARLPELFPHGVLEPAGFLRSNGFVDEARALLEASLAAFPDHHPGRVQLAHTLSRAGDAKAALAELRRVHEADADACPRDALMRTAEDAGEWQLLASVASEDLVTGQRESGGSFYDTWPTRGYLAGARLATGSTHTRDDLRERAPRHPEALGVLVRIERRLGHAFAGEDGAALTETAPGMARQVDRALEDALRDASEGGAS